MSQHSPRRKIVDFRSLFSFFFGLIFEFLVFFLIFIFYSSSFLYLDTLELRYWKLGLLPSEFLAPLILLHPLRWRFTGPCSLKPSWSTVASTVVD